MSDSNGIQTKCIEQPSHILIVDDEEGIRQLVALHLRKSGYSCMGAACPSEAYDLIAEQTFDAILTDVAMPGEDGITFLGKVHQTLPDVPVIIMTGFADLQVAINAIKHGAFDFIHKPFDFDYLAKVINRAVEHSRLRRVEQNYRAELEETVARRTDELKQALSELDAVRAKIITTVNQKSEFMSTITHEMRTPMNGVIGGLELLLDEDLSGIQREYAHLAREAADNMMELIDRLLSFNDGIKQSRHANLKLVDLPEIIASLARDYGPRFASKSLEFQAQVAPDMPCQVRCDPEQLSRLLEILLGNALKFTEAGSVKLEVGSETVDNGHRAIRMTVSDSGIGIPTEMLEYIFEPFTQVDGSHTRRFGGAGLGLSIARQIASLLGGHICAESVPGAGSRFHFVMNVDVP